MARTGCSGALVVRFNKQIMVPSNLHDGELGQRGVTSPSTTWRRLVTTAKPSPTAARALLAQMLLVEVRHAHVLSRVHGARVLHAVLFEATRTRTAAMGLAAHGQLLLSPKRRTSTS